MAQAVFLQRALDGFRRVLALGGAAGTGELLPLDDPELLSVVKPAIKRGLKVRILFSEGIFLLLSHCL